jgi:hypothetical protein
VAWRTELGGGLSRSNRKQIPFGDVRQRGRQKRRDSSGEVYACGLPVVSDRGKCTTFRKMGETAGMNCSSSCDQPSSAVTTQTRGSVCLGSAQCPCSSPCGTIEAPDELALRSRRVPNRQCAHRGSDEYRDVGFAEVILCYPSTLTTRFRKHRVGSCWSTVLENAVSLLFHSVISVPVYRAFL